MFNYTKEFRLLKKSDFLSLREGSRLLRSKSTIVYYKRNSLNFSRLGISASKKFGNAIKRNKFKRLARESFRNHLNIKALSFDILIVTNNRFSSVKEKIDAKKSLIISHDISVLFEKISS